MSFSEWKYELDSFLGMDTAKEVATFFGIDYSRLVYRLYKMPNDKKYTTFYLKKKNGTAREICAPISAIKNTQRKLNSVLQEIYQPKASVHGFIRKKNEKQRNIVTNAKNHANKKYVLNIDLANFFPSINFGRVRGVFMAYPFKFNAAVATVLAQISCFNNYLPQGAPSSPIVSNFICAKLDSQIMKLAKARRCFYSRYADDLTFSTSMKVFPKDLAYISSRGETKIGEPLKEIIERNGFKVNLNKVRLAKNYQRQVVTGLTVNKFPNVNRRFLRQLRAMLHAWDKFGLLDAEKEYFDKYEQTHRNPESPRPSFDDIVRGKLNFVKMVRGKGDKLYRSMFKKFHECLSEASMPIKYDKSSDKPLIITEGKTDWKHLKVALRTLGQAGLICRVEFQEYEDEIKMGDTSLLKLCKDLSKVNDKRVIICIFDRDNNDIVKKVSGKDKAYKPWGRNVYSLAIPIPSHRDGGLGISLEFYYKDHEITRTDKYGKRLFLSSEFLKPSGAHKTDRDVICQDKRFSRDGLCVIDDRVYTKKDKVVLKKNEFAENVLNAKDNFNNFDYSEFAKIFELVNEIVVESKKGSQ